MSVVRLFFLLLCFQLLYSKESHQYSFNENTKKLIITGNGEINEIEKLTYKDDIQIIELSEGYTSI